MTERTPLRALIVDDETLARQRLKDLLGKESGVTIVGAAENGREAVDAIRELQPDLVFLDVQMPGMTGIDVVAEIGPENMPPTIFVTAYDQYALRAFELAALDYLVKPFDDDRFEQAFRRARDMVELREVGRMTRRLVELVRRRDEDPAAAQSGEAPAQVQYVERIAVEMRGQVRVVPVEKIDYIKADGPYAELHVADKSYVIRERMQSLEERLDPNHFFRIHRSAIVRLDTIETLLRNPGGDYAVRLRDGTRLSVSRGRREDLEERLGIMR